MPSENPLLLPLPDSLLDQVEALARDLAFGAVTGAWRPFYELNVQGFALNPAGSEDESLFDRFDEKWQPDTSRKLHYFLEILEFVKNDGSVFDLTEKAIRLLEKPITVPSIFISYKRGESSALALALEARLKLAGNPNPYLDKLIPGGELWERELEMRVRGASKFVVILGPQAAQSPYISKEIAWALDARSSIIPVCLPDFTMNAAGIEGLAAYNAIFVRDEAAIDYENAINAVLNALGYATY